MKINRKEIILKNMRIILVLSSTFLLFSFFLFKINRAYSLPNIEKIESATYYSEKEKSFFEKDYPQLKDIKNCNPLKVKMIVNSDFIEEFRKNLNAKKDEHYFYKETQFGKEIDYVYMDNLCRKIFNLNNKNNHIDNDVKNYLYFHKVQKIKNSEDSK